MRTALPQTKSNGHAPQPGRVFLISGMCQEPRFLLRCGRGEAADFCLIYLGAPGLNLQLPGASAIPELPESGGEPYFVLRRGFDAGQAQVALRVDWEGVFTLLANDDGCAEAVFRELVEPGQPEEVLRQWSEDAATLAMFADLLRLG